MHYTLLLLWPAKFIQPGTISVRGTVLYRASSYIMICVWAKVKFIFPPQNDQTYTRSISTPGALSWSVITVPR